MIEIETNLDMEESIKVNFPFSNGMYFGSIT